MLRVVALAVPEVTLMRVSGLVRGVGRLLPLLLLLLAGRGSAEMVDGVVPNLVAALPPLLLMMLLHMPAPLVGTLLTAKTPPRGQALPDVPSIAV